MKPEILVGTKGVDYWIKHFRYDSIRIELPKKPITEDADFEVIEPKQLPEPNTKEE